MTRASNGIWSKSFDIASLVDGNYTLLVNASNRFGMRGNNTVAFHVDNTAPVVVSFVRTRTSTIYVGNTLTSADFYCNATDNSESFGGSVAIIITGLNTATEGTKTATCTATDLAGNTKTATVGYTVVSAGEGGGVGGGGEINLTAETVILEQLPAGQTIRLTDFPYPIVSIDMEAAQTITSSDLQVSILPSAESVPGAKVFTYFDINSNVPEGAIMFVRIIFKVDKSWLEQNGFSPDDVVLYKSNSGLWVNLQTEQTGETGSDYIYSATTSGFSTFAIAATKQILPAPEAAPITGAALAVPLSAFGGYAGLIVMIIMIVIFAIMWYRGRKKYIAGSKKGASGNNKSPAEKIWRWKKKGRKR
jgi:PGF-pre-PGF domain-containing protein